MIKSDIPTVDVTLGGSSSCSQVPLDHLLDFSKALNQLPTEMMPSAVRMIPRQIPGYGEGLQLEFSDLCQELGLKMINKSTVDPNFWRSLMTNHELYILASLDHCLPVLTEILESACGSQ